MELQQQEATQHEQADVGLQETIDESNTGITEEALGADGGTFFDPSEITDPGLLSQYKQMQAAFTRKMQATSQQSNEARDKIQQYDAFMQDPVGTIQRLASQYGLNVTRGQAQQMAEQQQGQDPRSWDDVYANAAQRVESQIMEKFQPIFNDVQQTKKAQIEAHLDANAPDWREYEDQMYEIISKHPTLGNDPMQVYRLAVPDEIQRQRATNAAYKRLKQTAESGQLSGGTTTSPAQQAPKRAKSFSEAAQMAMETLGNKGR